MSHPYGLIDAAVILLREGLEAMLVMVALLTWLGRSGQSAKRRWLWLGAGAGIVAAAGAGWLIHQVLMQLDPGWDPELLEGVTGLIAAVLLFYVSYWLHRQSTARERQGALQQEVSAALSSDRLLPLVVLAFTATFREGAETLLFYLGIAPSISTVDLWAGFGLGLGILGVIAGLIWGVGLRIPLKPFFRITTAMLYALGFKFLGSGIHALQEANVLPLHSLPSLTSWPSLGFYASWESCCLQLLVIAIGILVIANNARSQATQTDPA